MRNKKSTIFLFASILFFQFIIVNGQLHAQTANGLKNGIGGGGVSELPQNADSNVGYYVLAGAVAIGVGLYFYIKWHKNKFKKHSTKKADLETNTTLLGSIEKAHKLIPIDFSVNYKKPDKLRDGVFYFNLNYRF